MSNPIIYQAGGILLFLVFCVLTFFFTKTWRATHVVFAFLTFVSTLVFLSFAAMSHKTNITWRRQAKNADEALETQVKRNYELMSGTFNEDGERPETAPGLRSKLARELLDRGRVWRGCTVQTAADQQLNLTLSTLGPGEDPATAAPNQIEQNMVLYGFIEGADGYVRVFLGEFRTTAVADQTVTLAPADPLLLSQQQIAAIRAGGTWTLHEILSPDSHLAFSSDPRAVTRLTNTEGEKLFGEIDEATISPIIAETYQLLGFPQDTLHPLQAKRIKNLLRDGSQAINRDPSETDPPDVVYVKVEFIKELKDIDVDNNEGQEALTSDYFDSLGRSLVNRLRRGEEDPLSFAVGDVAIFDFTTANNLINDGFCKEIEPIFVRQTHDLNFELRALLLDALRIDADIKNLKRVSTSLTTANAKLDARKTKRETEVTDLNADLTQFTKERDYATEVANNLTVHRDKLLAELSALYRSNAILAQQLAARQKAIADDIKRREAEATAANN